MNRTFKAFYLGAVFILFGLGALIVAQLVIEDEIALQEGAKELFMEQEVIEPNEPNEVG